MADDGRHGGLVREVALANCVRLALHEQGVGTPVVLLHGWGETHRSFEPTLELLSTDFHVVTLDQRGSARDKPADGYRLEDVATDVVGMLDLLDLPVALVVGSSSGGYVAQQLAVGRRRC